jgi:hypothetical protein
VTVPVGTVEPKTWLTVAVNVTDWPNIDGLRDDDTAVIVALLANTVCSKALEVLLLKLALPPYTTVIV